MKTLSSHQSPVLHRIQEQYCYMDSLTSVPSLNKLSVLGFSVSLLSAVLVQSNSEINYTSLGFASTVLGLSGAQSSSDCVGHSSTCNAECWKENTLMGPDSWQDEGQQKKKSHIRIYEDIWRIQEMLRIFMQFCAIIFFANRAFVQDHEVTV